jgi:poly-gamma-glutamate synthesis protein (capsule biosynthesis protein)
MNAMSDDFETSMSIDDGFTLAAVGDCISARVLAPTQDREPGFAAAVQLVREADVGFGNLETGVFDIRGFAGYQRQMEDWALQAPPEVAADLKSLGFDLMSRANNHAVDWSIEGMRETGDWLDGAGIVHAGVGETLAQARAPRYLETPKGRVGLVSLHTTNKIDQAQALDQFGQVPPRPGFNSLRLRLTVRLPGPVLEGLREVEKKLDPAQQNAISKPGSKGFTLLGTRFEEGSTAVGFEPFPEDMVEILKAVRSGKQNSDFLVVSAHVHEEGVDGDTHPAFLTEVAHALIDAGADAFIGHGVHRMWPIEIYDGKPILYGLGNFIFIDVLEPLTDVLYDDARDHIDRAIATDADVNHALNLEGFNDARYFESVIARCRVSDGRITTSLHPVELGFGTGLTRSGIPRLAHGEQAQKTLDRVAAMSEQLGTRLSIECESAEVRGA